MSSIPADTIFGLPRRPAIADAGAGAILGAISLGLLTKDWKAAMAGGAIGGALAGRKQPLEMAIREYFQKRGLGVSFFYRAPRSVKVTFSYAPNAFWTVESIMPDSLQGLSEEDRDDWLYGSLIKRELPKVLKTIKQLYPQ
jgi:hypothetical protein